jgi:tetratricopeptide (TPR) repeat protein
MRGERGAFFWLALLLSSTCCFASPTSFEQANAKYKEGDFKEASALYQKALSSGQTTSAVYFNLGNASLKAGEKGQAMVYYERARKAAPRDEDLLWNIRVLQGALTDRIEDRSHFVLAGWKRFLKNWTSDELALCLAFFLALSAGLGLAGLFLPALRGRVGSLAPMLWVAVFVSGVVTAGKMWETKDSTAVVLDKQTAAYYGPSEQETRALLLHEGAQGKVLDESGDWLYLVLQNKNTGWVRKNSCEIV